MNALTRTTLSLLLAGCLTFLVGCSADDDPAPVTPPPTADATDTADGAVDEDAVVDPSDVVVDPSDAVTPDPEVSDTPEPEPDVSPEEDVADEDTTPPEDAGATCVAQGGGCWDDAACCEGFCSYSGMDYVPGACEMPKANGSYCLEDDWCESGICADQLCQQSDCGGKLASCWSTFECCEGLHCSYAFAYVEGSCDPPLGDGSPCQADDWCESGHCIDGHCNPEGCVEIPNSCTSDDVCCSGICTHNTCTGPLENGEACDADSDCLSGSCKGGKCGDAACQDPGTPCFGDVECCEEFCTYDGLGYAPGFCSLKKGNGAYCSGDSWCQSGNCVASTCVEAGCIAMDEPCYDASECCSGMCSWTGDDVLPGACGAKQANGETCVASAWCQSGNCEEGLCAPYPADMVTFTDVWDMILVPMGCTNSSCHGASMSTLILDDMSQAFNALSMGSSMNPVCGATDLVVSGDPEASSLWVRVRPMELDTELGLTCFPKMPLGSEGLTLSEAQLVHDWIASGALP